MSRKIFAALLAVTLGACTTERAAHHSPEQSWDQDNLKRYDMGCPTAVFIAPGGDLVQCQTSITDRLSGLGIVASAPPLHATVAGYRTIEEAALDGLQKIALKPTANFYEWGGAIVKTTNGYVALSPRTDYAAQHVHIDDEAGDVVGSYHTHVCHKSFTHEFFSPADMSDPIFFHRTIFMGDFCTGLAHVFKPGDKPDVERSGGADSPWLSAGHIIGKFTTPHDAL